jgi:hypothetical protein
MGIAAVTTPDPNKMLPVDTCAEFAMNWLRIYQLDLDWNYPSGYHASITTITYR